MEGADADTMCFGHTHKTYHRILPTEVTENVHYRQAINIGSIQRGFLSLTELIRGHKTIL